MILIHKPAVSAILNSSAYITESSESDLVSALTNSMQLTLEIFKNIAADKETFRYAEGKWNFREMLGHLIDAERIFAYRALRFARLDPTPLPPFEEDDYAEASDADMKSLSILIEEYKLIRKSTLLLYHSLTDMMLDFPGTASDKKVTARGIGFMIAGHNYHHCKILQERYLPQLNTNQ